MDFVSNKTIFPLIKRKIGGVTYEHTLVQHFYDDVWTGDAERNLYVDENHEICLCAHYNFRVKGKYEFIPDYRFYITKERMCLDLHWNLGCVTKPSLIIQMFNSLEEAKTSQFYDDFCILKKRIDKALKEQKKSEKSVNYDFCTITQGTKQDKKGKDVIRIFEMPVSKTKEYVQILLDLKKDEWVLSTSKEPVMDMFCYFDDFLELDEKELHLRTIKPMNNKELPKQSPYYKLLKFVKEELGLIGGVSIGQINVEEIKYMKFVESVGSVARLMKNLPPTIWKEEIFYYPDGKLIFHEMISNGEKVNKRIEKQYSAKKINKMFEDIGKYLSNKRFKQDIFCDDSSGTLIIYYKDGHKEKYDRGLSNGEDCLYFHILNVKGDMED